MTSSNSCGLRPGRWSVSMPRSRKVSAARGLKLSLINAFTTEPPQLALEYVDLTSP